MNCGNIWEICVEVSAEEGGGTDVNLFEKQSELLKVTYLECSLITTI